MEEGKPGIFVYPYEVQHGKESSTLIVGLFLVEPSGAIFNLSETEFLAQGRSSLLGSI